jgi:RHS repeat-associated protein
VIRVDIAGHQGFDSGDGVAFGSLRLQRAHELRQPWRAYPGRHPMQDLEYWWDGYGNLMKRTDFNRSLGETFQYDDLNRLKDSTVTNPANNGPTISNINYDSVGDIQNRTLSGTVETYSYDPKHPYAVNGVTDSSGTIYSASYDADGDMTSRNGYQIQWTVDNLPESIASAQGSSTFSYDPEGNRYYQSATLNGATTDTTYIGGLFEVVSTLNSTEFRHNIIADGQIVAVHTIDQSGNAHTSYLNYDHLGSVDAITDDSGAVVQTMSFDAYGQRRDPSNWDYDLSQNTIATLKDYTDRGYTDQEQLDNVALVDLNGRVYDPTVGRMISADPMIPEPLFGQSFNRYSYVENSPLENVDPSGYSPNWGLIEAGIINGVSGMSAMALGVAMTIGDEEGDGNPIGGFLVAAGGFYIAGVGALDVTEGLQGYGTPVIPPSPLSTFSPFAMAESVLEDPGLATVTAFDLSPRVVPDRMRGVKHIRRPA